MLSCQHRPSRLVSTLKQWRRAIYFLDRHASDRGPQRHIRRVPRRGITFGRNARCRSPRGDQCYRRRSPAPWVARQGDPHCAAGRQWTSGDVRDQPKVADGASEFLRDVFGKERNPSRLVYGVASLPLGTAVELEIIFEVRAREKRFAEIVRWRHKEKNLS